MTALPALLIGATLWMVAGLVPACTVSERERLTSPNAAFDVVIFSRDCGNTEANTQAALVPPGEEVPFDAASFYSVGVDADLSPRWISVSALELTTPSGQKPYRSDETVAGVSVTYRAAN
ncbi:hypothetical protein [Devosia soli]|uniref:hypothetical protein n=1 Tax=Devosia soli TaxID=361041 RepID=UPI00128E9165|nr:hypothetical protein [Devosia soli]